MVCAAKGYPLVVTMAESFSVERRKLMRFLGAKVVLTPAPLGATGMIDKAKELAAANGWFHEPAVRERGQPGLPRQDHGAGNPARTSPKSSTTGSPASAPAARSRASPACSGTRGRTPRSSSREPETAPMLTSHAEQARNADGSPAAPPPRLEAASVPGLEPRLHAQDHRRRGGREADRRDRHHPRPGGASR